MSVPSASLYVSSRVRSRRPARKEPLQPRALSGLVEWLRGDLWNDATLEAQPTPSLRKSCHHEDGRLRASWLGDLPICLFRP